MKTLMKSKGKAPVTKPPVAPNREINDEPPSDEEDDAYMRKPYQNVETENGRERGDYD